MTVRVTRLGVSVGGGSCGSPEEGCGGQFVLGLEDSDAKGTWEKGQVTQEGRSGVGGEKREEWKVCDLSIGHREAKGRAASQYFTLPLSSTMTTISCACFLEHSE